MANAVRYSFERVERKYFLSPEQYSFLFSRIESFVRPDDYGAYTLCNIYYDTDDWRLVRASVEKPAYKEKLRLRSYGAAAEAGPVFAELKKKCGGIVYKRRIGVRAAEAGPLLADPAALREHGQIGRELAWFQQFYRTGPKVFIAYDRTAFAGLEDPDLRITFDRNLRWRDDRLDLRLGDDGRPILPDDRILMEVKIADACPLWLSRPLSQAGIFPVSFSKYGACYQRHILRKEPEKDKKGGSLCA